MAEQSLAHLFDIPIPYSSSSSSVIDHQCRLSSTSWCLNNSCLCHDCHHLTTSWLPCICIRVVDSVENTMLMLMLTKGSNLKMFCLEKSFQVPVAKVASNQSPSPKRKRKFPPSSLFTPSCKTLGGSVRLTAAFAIFCLAHRQMRAEDIFRYINII